MFSSIRRRFTYINVAMTLALVFSMTGGAYAAGKYLITSTKQISPKVLKQLKGAQGLAGPEGKPGQAGTAGAAGAKGEKGERGEKGEKGDPGAPGTNGKEGSPWTAGGTLPSEKTEKGDWALDVASSGSAMVSGVSFVLPLEHKPIPIYVKAKAVTPAHCSGTVAEPGAEPGYLCVFANAEGGLAALSTPNPAICSTTNSPPGVSSPLVENCLFNGEVGTDLTGFAIAAVLEAGGTAYGSWAVTAE